MLKSDFIKALDQVQEEKGISKQSLLNLMETALATAYRRAFNPPESIRVHVDPDTAQIAIFGRRRVVDAVQDSSTEISLDDARQLGAASLGDMVDVPLPPEDFARLAIDRAGGEAMAQFVQQDRHEQDEHQDGRVDPQPGRRVRRGGHLQDQPDHDHRKREVDADVDPEHPPEGERPRNRVAHNGHPRSPSGCG